MAQWSREIDVVSRHLVNRHLFGCHWIRCQQTISRTLRTDTGRAHPLHAYQRWLAELGLVTADPIDVSDEPPITLVTGSPRLRPPT